MSEVKIRKAKSIDASNIAKLNDEVYCDMVSGRREFFKPGSKSPDMTDFFKKTIRESDSLVLVAEMNDDFAGYVYASLVDEQDDLIDIPFVAIDQIAVVKNFRGLGIGKMLLCKAEQWAKDGGVHVVQLAVFETQHDAKRLYEKQGYKTIMTKMEKIF